MGTFSLKARKAGEKSRRLKMGMRKVLAKNWGGTTGDYFPSKIKKTMEERSISPSVVPKELLPKSTVGKEEDFPLDHPIFAEKPKPEKRGYKRVAGTRESIIINALLDLIRKLV